LQQLLQVVPDAGYQVLAGLVRADKNLTDNALTQNCGCLMHVASEFDFEVRDEPVVCSCRRGV
jgi:hypothetical protein